MKLPFVSRMRFDRGELAGSLGDLGTFLPLVVALSAQCGLSFPAALFFAGLFNVVTALGFGIPMAVQPMKAIAAIALAEGLGASEIVAAGMWVSGAVALLGLSGALGWIQRNIPTAVVRGLQLALALTLAMRGLRGISNDGPWDASHGVALALAAGLCVVALRESRRVPAALVLFLAGLGLVAWRDPQAFGAVELSPWWPTLAVPSLADFDRALWSAALPQLPLTLLNSVVAVCALSVDLFPEHPAPPRKVALSVGIMNLVAGPFGALPMCHGAGGLAGQYRFGARTGGSILMLGLAKMALAVLFGASLVAACSVFPASILGVMLIASGLELGHAARDVGAPRAHAVALLTVAACLALDDFALGFLIGLGLELALRFATRGEAS